MKAAAGRRRFQEHAEHLAEHEPGLVLTVDEPQREARIAGRIEVPVGGTVTRTFDIEIRYTGLDPFSTPTARDTARRFPPDGHRHVEPDGAFCMWLPQTDPSRFDRPDGLARYLRRVREFIVLQLMYEQRRRLNITPRWAGPEWPHGVDGHKQWVRELLAEHPPCDLHLLLRDIAGGSRGTSPDKPCPCRSGRSYRRCHRPVVEVLRRGKKDRYVNAALAEILKESR